MLISVLSAKMTWLIMKEFLKPKPNRKIYWTRVFFKLLKLVKEENLKTTTELVKEYIKIQKIYNMNHVKGIRTFVNKIRVKLIFVSCLISCRFIR